jgi:hypothetical protein
MQPQEPALRIAGVPVESLGDLSPLLILLSCMVAIASVLIGYFSLRESTRNVLLGKKADVLMSCNARFQALVSVMHDIEMAELKHSLERATAPLVATADETGGLRRRVDLEGLLLRRDHFFRQFWDLHWDQFTYFRDVLIEQRVYEAWMISLHEMLAQTSPETPSMHVVAGKTFRAAWYEYADRQVFRGARKIFADFISEIAEIGGEGERSTRLVAAAVDRLRSAGITHRYRAARPA